MKKKYYYNKNNSDKMSLLSRKLFYIYSMLNPHLTYKPISFLTS